jgi:hypothetical protein
LSLTNNKGGNYGSKRTSLAGRRPDPDHHSALAFLALSHAGAAQAAIAIFELRCPALGQQQTFRSAIAMSALPPKPDIEGGPRNVRQVPIADIARGRLRSPRIRFLQQQGRKLFVFVHELLDVILNLNTGMDNRPKMSGSDESKKR